MHLKVLLLTSFLLSSGTVAMAQGVAINTTGSAADNSAMLDISSNTQGVLVPRMDSAHRTGISSPAVGLLVYQTDGVSGFYYYASGGWTTLSTPATPAFNDTLTQNLYTNGYLLSGDGTTGIQLNDNGQIVAKGAFGSGSDLTESGAGTKMIWYPKLAAFRAGATFGTEWDITNVGSYSVAMGNGTIASGNTAISLGTYTLASGNYSTAIGYNARATGNNSTAIGVAAASGYGSTALGFGTTASGYISTALGAYVSTSTNDGSFIIGDISPNTTGIVLNTSALNQMMMRFAGGYMLYSNAATTTGVSLAAGGGSWASISDRRKKENFTMLDKEDMLTKVCAMPVTRWNYKSQPTTQKHVGPMAQDFYAAFGLDGVGCDTTINTVDIDGVNMIAIQALAEKNEQLMKEVDALKDKLSQQDKNFAVLQDKIEAMLTKQEEQQKLSIK